MYEKMLYVHTEKVLYIHVGTGATTVYFLGGDGTET
jgi:hypothetical protein